MLCMLHDSNVVSLKAASKEDWSVHSSVLSSCIELCTHDPSCDRNTVKCNLWCMWLEGWYPAGFRVDPPPEARARQHLLGDDGLAPYISRLVCRSFNVFYQGCFRRRKILESARRLSGYLLACLVDIRPRTRHRIQ